MKRALIIIVLGGALAAGYVLLIAGRRGEAPQPPAGEATQPPPLPQRIATPPPAPIQAPAGAPGAAPPAPLAPNTTVAVPGGDPNGAIPAAPRDQRIYRDHRNTGETPPPIKVTPQGMSAAGAAIRPAVASCLSGPETLQFVLTMSGGRAQAREPRLMNADRQPDAQACIEKALAQLSWATPDKDGSTPVMLPILATSSSGPKR
jgi:hypothetical protein